MHRLLFVWIVILFLAGCGVTVLTPTPGPTDETSTVESTRNPDELPEKIKSVTVFIIVDKGNINGAPAFGYGTGTIIDESGLIVTNAHIVTGWRSLEVLIGGEGQPIRATVLGVAECSDLAVIKLLGNEDERYPFLPWANEDLKIGMPVHAAGFPQPDPNNPIYTFTSGNIIKEETPGHGPWASVDVATEHDAIIDRGNSGGGLFNDKAELVAINYAYRSTEAHTTSLAITWKEAEPLVKRLAAGENVRTIGIFGEADDFTFSGEEIGPGILVKSVQANTPAADVGLQVGDLIIEFAGGRVGSDGTMKEYCDVLHSQGTDVPIQIGILRPTADETLVQWEGQINGHVLEPKNGPTPQPTTPTSTPTPTPTSGPTPTPTATVDRPPQSPPCKPLDYDCILRAVGYNLQDGRMVVENQGPVTIPLDEYPFGFWGSYSLQNSLTEDFVLHINFERGDEIDQCEFKFHEYEKGAYQIDIKSSELNFSNHIYDSGKTPLVSQPIELDSSNELVLVASGDIYTVYINGLKNPVATATDSAYLNGTISLMAWSPDNPGDQSCTYSNVWVWAPNS